MPRACVFESTRRGIGAHLRRLSHNPGWVGILIDDGARCDALIYAPGRELRCLTAPDREREPMMTASSADARRDELVERLFGSALGALDLLCVYLGDRLGMYKALADTGPSTSAELAG